MDIKKLKSLVLGLARYDLDSCPYYGMPTMEPHSVGDYIHFDDLISLLDKLEHEDRKLIRLTRTEQLALKIGDIVWVSNGDITHCYEYEIKPLTGGRAVGGISLRDAKKLSLQVYRKSV